MKLDPKTKVGPRTYKAALDAVNALRRIEGRRALSKLPKGEQFLPNRCPIANALKLIGVDKVRATTIRFPGAGTVKKNAVKVWNTKTDQFGYYVLTPDSIRHFIEAFDK